MHGLSDTASLPPIHISGLAYDSRRVQPGNLFIALSGQSHNGHDYVSQALANGASAVLGSQRLTDLPVPYIQVDAPRRCLATLAARFYGDPTLHMPVIGITGTNGKTTCSYLIESILREAGLAPAVIGTIAYRFGRHSTPSTHTTPEALDLQRWIAEARTQGANALVMEVSSHGLEQDRIRNCHLDAAVFTNLSQDHLDFHSTMDRYYEAKAKLFTEILPSSAKQTKRAYFNWDDPYGRRLCERVDGIRCGRETGLDYSVTEETYTINGLQAVIQTPRGPIKITSSLIGPFNLTNILLAVAACQGLGIESRVIEAGVQHMPGVPGRLEAVPFSGNYKVFIDYAHTPDALNHVIHSLRGLGPRRLITVFGCGGDRDQSKRPLMGEAAGCNSDLVIITSDNPRSEAPEHIIDQIIPGIERGGLSEYNAAQDRGYLVIADRRQAIKRALQEAGPNDIVLIAGKGHENYQIIGTKKRHFDDKEEVLQALGEKQ